MAKENVLIIEDEEDIVELVRYNLAREGFRVEAAGSGEEGLAMIRRRPPDAVILDLMLPGLDGLEVCRRLRQDAGTRLLPILMLTARGEEADVVAGLELGADDYLTKPFSPRVLSARLKAVLRRRAAPPTADQTPLDVQGLIIHPGRHEATADGRPLNLTLSEFRILRYLAGRAGWVFTRRQIVDAVHGEDYPVTERSVDVQIVGLRRKLGRRAELIETVRGVGYRFRESPASGEAD